VDVCPDYADLFKTFNAHSIKFLVVGGQAVIFYTEPRYTKDMDVWIPMALNDPHNVYQALKSFGCPLVRVTIEDFKNPKMILQIGVPPVRVDIMMSVTGVSVKRAWKNRKRGVYGSVPINLLGREDLVRVKKSAGRPQDLLDVDKLLLVSRLKKKRRRKP